MYTDIHVDPLFRGYELPKQPVVLTDRRTCSFCDAVKFQFETPTFCCSLGEIRLVVHDSPSTLLDLFCGSSVESNNFRQYIRIYNSSFAFSSMGVHLDENLLRQKSGIYTFRVQGQFITG